MAPGGVWLAAAAWLAAVAAQAGSRKNQDSCMSFFAVDPATAQCFLDIHEYNGSKVRCDDDFGFVNHGQPLQNDTTLFLTGAAKKCNLAKGKLVGTVEILVEEFFDCTVAPRIRVEEEYRLVEYCAWFSTQPVPQDENGDYTFSDGEYEQYCEYNITEPKNVYKFKYRPEGLEPEDFDTAIYFIVHGRVCRADANDIAQEMMELEAPVEVPSNTGGGGGGGLQGALLAVAALFAAAGAVYWWRSGGRRSKALAAADRTPLLAEL